jgi:dTDP-4-amino-4,6-dideoxygalactose transaminase
MLNLIPTEAWEYSFKDLIRGLSAALSLRKPKKPLYIQGIGTCIPLRSARAAIIVALKALELPLGARIGVPLYCCPVVFKAIDAAACTPRFIDSDPRTFCVSVEDLLKKSTNLEAMIAVHMFGNVCDMPSLQMVMKGKPVIEDCAQSLGSHLDGRLAGSFGIIAAFSFRSGKYLSSGEGGALFSKETDICLRMSQLTAALPMSTRLEEFKHVLGTFIRSKLRSKPLWGVVGQSIWSLYNKKVDFVVKSPIILSQIFKSNLAIVRNRMTFLDSMIKAQRANAEYYIRNLQLDPSMMYLEMPGTFYNRFIFPLTFRSSGDRDEMAAYLQSQQISSSKPYEEVIEGAAKHYGYEGDCPVAEKLLRRTLVVPSHYKLEKKHIKQIARCINKGWSKINSQGKKLL